MRVLALETATPAAGVALVDANGVLASRTIRAPMRHLEWLAAAIDGMLRDLGAGPETVEGVAVGRGPGGFTGLRIGIATAAAWSRARGVPVLGMATLEVLAHSVESAGPVVAVLDARRGEVAGALYRLGAEPECLLPPVVAPPAAFVEELRAAFGTGEAAGPVVLAGDGLHRHRAALVGGLAGLGVTHVIERPDGYPHAEAAGALARPRLLRGERHHAADLLPVYGRRPAVRAWQETSARAENG